MSGLTMGSLFDGIGGFPLAAIRSDITPVWASEIEAFPIEVTKQRFPSMIHVGDITKLNGAELPPVDIICGGSPCQDLSVAGARAGLSGARSGLFMEQVRLVKEMRNADEQRGRAGHAVRPRYMLWENVPGAFSSGTPKGEDFRIVLEEIVRVKCGSVYVPGPYTGPHQVVPTMSARYGTGGNNVPLVEQEETFCITGNAIDRQPQNGGNGIGYQRDIAYTLTATDHLSGYPDK